MKEARLKVTPQRLAVLEAVYTLQDHPTAEQVITRIRRNHPSIASGTVYKVLDILVDRQLLRRVKTEKDIMRYDGITEQHHHLYCSESEHIEDYHDTDLDHMLLDYFKEKEIPGFNIENIRLQINGKFLKKTNK